MGSMLSFVRFDSIRFDSSRGPETNPFYLKTTTDDAFLVFYTGKPGRFEKKKQRNGPQRFTARPTPTKAKTESTLRAGARRIKHHLRNTWFRVFFAPRPTHCYKTQNTLDTKLPRIYIYVHIYFTIQCDR